MTVILAGSAAFTALILSEAHDRQRLALSTEAKTRAAFASQYIDESLNGLVRTLTILISGSLADAHERDEFYTRSKKILSGKGVTVVAWNKNLDALLPSGTGSLAGGEKLNELGRQAAEKALREHRPQLTSYGENEKDAGENLWMGIVTSSGEAVIIQAHIPTSYFMSVLKSIASSKPWLLAIVRPDGRFLAHSSDDASFDKFAFASVKGVDASTYAQSLADVSEFGWRVGAATPFTALGAQSSTNWYWFFLIMALLTLLSVAGSYSVLQRMAVPYLPESLIQDRPAVTSKRDPQNPPVAVDHLRHVLAAGGIGTWEWRQGANIVCDPKAAELFGLPRGASEVPALALFRNVDATDRKLLFTAARRALAKPEDISRDVKVKSIDGKSRWFAVRGTFVPAAGTSAGGLAGIVYDVTDQKQALDRTDSLLREVSHRTKNLLALILAMARLTARDNFDVKAYLKQFALRVAGLSASQDIIVAADWQSADLGTLARGEVEAVARTNASRMTISGPIIAVTPEAAQTLGIIITELTLNAIEHGALSLPDGHVNLSWSVPEANVFRMSWQESGGVRYDPAKPKRYGMTIVERLAIQGLKASLTFGSSTDGFQWTLESPLPTVGSPIVQTS